MTSINEKMGLKRAGKRSMMKLPQDRQQRAALTAAQCPQCGAHGAAEFTTWDVVKWVCTWCNHIWEPSGT